MPISDSGLLFQAGAWGEVLPGFSQDIQSDNFGWSYDVDVDYQFVGTARIGLAYPF